MPRNYWTPARIAQFEAMDAKNKAKHKHDEEKKYGLWGSWGVAWRGDEIAGP